MTLDSVWALGRYTYAAPMKKTAGPFLVELLLLLALWAELASVPGQCTQGEWQ